MATALETNQNTFGCVAHTIKLRSGLYLDLANPQPDQFTFADIAGALSKICRFGAQCDHFYSVAEHSFWCSEQAELDGASRAIQIAALMHDATEAFLGDCVRPLKLLLPEYSRLEKLMESAIGKKFQIDFPACSRAVKDIDNAMLIAERRRLFEPDAVLWTGEKDVRQLNVFFCLWESRQAEALFTRRATELGIAIG